jgi:hypothetical protein
MVRDERRVVQAGTPATAARTHAQLHVAALICGGDAGHVDATAAAVPVYFQPEQSQQQGAVVGVGLRGITITSAITTTTTITSSPAEEAQDTDCRCIPKQRQHQQRRRRRRRRWKAGSGREGSNTPAQCYKAKRHIADNLRQTNAKEQCTHGCTAACCANKPVLRVEKSSEYEGPSLCDGAVLSERVGGGAEVAGGLRRTAAAAA